MAKNLVIVESPAKAKTIQKFLGNDFQVMSSYGHIRDLHKKDFSIDVGHGFEPLYEVPQDKQELVKKLRKAADEAQVVWLASDEDREGEAIAWHLLEVLNLDAQTTKRIVFHEITKQAILQAIEQPRSIDKNLVDAQQARRVLDRIVGFELSPVLWKKIRPGLSAGRVQSVAVRLIAEREKEIKGFKAEAYYRVTAKFTPRDSAEALAAELDTRFATRDEALTFLHTCREATFSVASDPIVKPVKKSPAPPFTTSTLQQEAARKLGMSVSQTMRVAQSLYEAGHITYMRTDSVNLSEIAVNAISQEIKEHIGSDYLKRRKFHTTSKGAQEAHEAIRPTYISNHDITGTAQEKKLYSLIWKRTIASQMADAELERTTVEIDVSNRQEAFVATGEMVKFDGFLKIYRESTDDETPAIETSHILPRQLAGGTTLDLGEMIATQRYTQQPVRYSEASLVRKLEELGIGRPSTYAPTISTIQQREYVTKGVTKGDKRDFEVITLKDGDITQKSKSEVIGSEKGKLLPTDVGMIVNDFLMSYFPDIMDYNFTASVEEDFDKIAAGKEKWNEEISRFYAGFHPNIESVSALRLEHKVGERVLGTDPKTGRQVSVKIGRFGPIVQLGSSDDEQKPRFMPLRQEQSVATITLDEALKLFELPHTIGTLEGADVIVAIGRFGPYVKVGGESVSIPKDIDPATIDIEQVRQLITEKRKAEAQKVLKTFENDPELLVLNGRYGPYISYRKQNYKIPRKLDAAALTYDECKAIVSDEANASSPRSRRRSTTTKR